MASRIGIVLAFALGLGGCAALQTAETTDRGGTFSASPSGGYYDVTPTEEIQSP